ncbi:MAG TPA: DUF5696 domain-containing protein [Candidatus Hydrogenedentes bacterium]|nr:DUF5696 domain-containing protein [Candidatus Hydrogenedentota bacterium]HPG68475.1 DUF5696 domain-containing protein [Candidatus Hydrogenedentota bacterium]
MMLLSFMLSVLAADEDIDARMAVLNKHLERLAAVDVPESLQVEKDAKLAALRQQLDAGAKTGDEVNALYLAMDEVRQWLWKNAVERPSLAEGAFEETDAAWILRNPWLELTWQKADFAIRVKTAATEWQFAPCGRKDVELAKAEIGFLDAGKRSAEMLRTSYSIGLRIELAEFPAAPDLDLVVGVDIERNEARFSVVPVKDSTEFGAIAWPKPLVMGNTEADLSVIPCMQGMILPGNYGEAIRKRDLTNSRSLYMSWWGQIHEGHGVHTILESSDDAGAAYDHPAGGPTVIQPLWYSSMRTLRYPRSIRYTFDDEATYVTMAKRYRRFMKDTGRFVSLAEKCARTPNLDKVVGSPVVHVGALYHNVKESHYYNKENFEANHALVPFHEIAAGLEELHKKGIERAYVHLDGWGFYGYDNGHPDPLPVGAEQGGWDGLRAVADTCDRLGWVFAVHDQYRDFYFSAASFDDRLVMREADGSRQEHATWCGGPQTYLSAVFAPGYARRNHDLFAKHDIKVRGAYLDVFAVVPLEESYQRLWPMTRTDCAEARTDCFDLLRARGYVVSSEEPADRFVPALDLVHHGPYDIFSNEESLGIPTPLFGLVYHDSILLPWCMSQGGGWGIPKSDAGQLHCLLNAGLPYVGPDDPPEQIARVNEAAQLAARCGTLEMVNHEFLDDTWRRQRSTFSDGTAVTVDFDAKTYTIEYGPSAP